MKLVQFNILLRQWMRGGVSTVVSLVSLALGLICSTILLLFAVEEFRAADALTPDPSDKYMLMMERHGQTGRFLNSIFKGDPATIASHYPQVIDYAIFKECNGTWQNEPKNYLDKQSVYTIAATPSFTKYYNIRMIEGNLDSVLAAPDRIAITPTYAAKLFPDKSPIGQPLTLKVSMGNDTIVRNYTVTAVIDDSKRAAIRFRAIYRLPDSELQETSYQDGRHHALIRLARGTDHEKLSAQIINDSLPLAFGAKYSLRLDPINETYLVSDTDNASDSNVVLTRNKSSLYIGITLAFIILLIAAFNYINITLTRSASRLKNLAGQRIMGATKWNVRGQIFADTAINVALALILALVFLPLSMEGFNSFMDSRISMADLIQPMNALYIMGLLALLIIIPSVSLIVKFSIRNPLETFKNPEGRRVRAAQSLVVAQIVVSIVLLTFGINVTRQMDKVAHSINLSDQIIEVQSSDFRTFSKAFVDRAKTSASTKKLIVGHLGTMSYPVNYLDKSIYATWIQATPEFFDMYELGTIEGRIFEPVKPDNRPATINCVVSQSFIKALGIKGSPIGTMINGTQHRIIGVVPDIRVVDAKTDITPMLYTYSPYLELYPTCLYIRFSGSAEDKIAELHKIFKETNDEGILTPRMLTVAQFFLNKNPEIERMKTMIDVFTTISFLLTAFGLFGLSWYMVERRRREIAIRKTYGATVARMVAMLCRSFLWQSLIAIVIALPTAYFISGYWLEGFVFRVDNAWWVLAVTSAISLVVIFATVIGQTIRAALTNPVKYIKTE